MGEGQELLEIAQQPNCHVQQLRKAAEQQLLEEVKLRKEAALLLVSTSSSLTKVFQGPFSLRLPETLKPLVAQPGFLPFPLFLI